MQPQYGGTVAQLVEQRTENPRVTGSIPVGTTTKTARRCLAFLFYVFGDEGKQKKHLLRGAFLLVAQI